MPRRRARPGSSESSGWPSARRKRSRISTRFLWIAGTRMCDGSSPASWTISSARSVSTASMPAAASASLSPISSVVSDLTFTTSRGAGSADEPGDDLVGLGCVARPVDDVRPPLDRRLELEQIVVEMPEDASLERAPAARSSSQSGRSAMTAARFPRIVGVAMSELRRSCVSRRRLAARPAGKPRRSCGGQDLGEVRWSARRRAAASSAPPICIRHELSTAVHDLGARLQDAAHLVVEHRARRVGVLDRERAAEAAALASRRGSSTRSSPRTARRSAQRRVADAAARAASGRSGGT